MKKIGSIFQIKIKSRQAFLKEMKNQSFYLHGIRFLKRERIFLDQTHIQYLINEKTSDEEFEEFRQKIFLAGFEKGALISRIEFTSEDSEKENADFGYYIVFNEKGYTISPDGSLIEKPLEQPSDLFKYIITTNPKSQIGKKLKQAYEEHEKEL